MPSGALDKVYFIGEYVEHMAQAMHGVPQWFVIVRKIYNKLKLDLSCGCVIMQRHQICGAGYAVVQLTSH